MKCSVCAQDIPEDRYSEHLETEHGVTDDPTAILIQHLTGLHSTGGDEDGDEGLPEEEPSDADAFEEFLAAHPAPPDADHDEDGEEEAAASTPVDEEEGEEGEEPVEHDEPERAVDEDADAAVDGGSELTDEDEAEFERMLATYPDVDLRKGRPEPAAEEEPREEVPAARAGAAAAGAAAAGATATATADHDATTFAVWDQARGLNEDDEDILVVAPTPAQEQARRRRQAALVGLGAVIILIAIAVIYLLTRDTSTKHTATAPVTFTVPTTVAPTFLPGPPGGATTTVVTQPPVTAAPPATTATTAPPATTATPATTAPPSGDPASQIKFQQVRGVCTNGQLQAGGTVANNNAQTYTFSFTVTFRNSAGQVLGTGNGSVAHMPPHSTAPFNATGTCTNVTGATSHSEQITSITPG